MNINLKNRKELTFLAIGILMLIIVIFCLVSATRFLARNLNQAFSRDASTIPAALKFQLERAELLYNMGM